MLGQRTSLPETNNGPPPPPSRSYSMRLLALSLPPSSARLTQPLTCTCHALMAAPSGPPPPPPGGSPKATGRASIHADPESESVAASV